MTHGSIISLPQVNSDGNRRLCAQVIENQGPQVGMPAHGPVAVHGRHGRRGARDRSQIVTRDPLAALSLARWIREHAIGLVVALVQAGRLDLAREFATEAGVDLDAWAERARAELDRRGLPR